MKTSIAITAVLAATLLISSHALADNSFGFGVKAGTLGLGAEASWQPIPWLDFRLGANQYDYNDAGAVSDINYDATLALDTYYATANFRFPASPFRMSLGAFSNGNQVHLTGRPAQAYQIGDNPIPYTPEEVGSLRSTTNFESVAPYLGAGFDFDIVGRLGLMLDFGVLWQGDPTVSLSADGLLATDPGFIADLEDERMQMQNDVGDLKAYPVISLGFNFNF